jgi:hypothetical protein
LRPSQSGKALEPTIIWRSNGQVKLTLDGVRILNSEIAVKYTLEGLTKIEGQIAGSAAEQPTKKRKSRWMFVQLLQW